jgi:hypothetical protein
MADLLEASIAVLVGHREDAVAPLRNAVAAFDSIEHALYAAVARCRLGEVLGGDEGAALATQGRLFLSAGGARAPERVLHVFSPGFAPA